MHHFAHACSVLALLLLPPLLLLLSPLPALSPVLLCSNLGYHSRRSSCIHTIPEVFQLHLYAHFSQDCHAIPPWPCLAPGWQGGHSSVIVAIRSAESLTHAPDVSYTTQDCPAQRRVGREQLQVTKE
jgi:hypothetical protein